MTARLAPHFGVRRIVLVQPFGEKTGAMSRILTAVIRGPERSGEV
jgi:hypothetical protein